MDKLRPRLAVHGKGNDGDKPGYALARKRADRLNVDKAVAAEPDYSKSYRSHGIAICSEGLTKVCEGRRPERPMCKGTQKKVKTQWESARELCILYEISHLWVLPSMNEIPINPILAIQSMLAPALGISAVGLLLLGLNNRYSIIINRIRLLNEERRKYLRYLQQHDHLEYADNIRFMSISNQSPNSSRSRLVRNAILSMQTAIALFVLTSVTIGVNLFVLRQTQ
jgi:hypothetical protein